MGSQGAPTDSLQAFGAGQQGHSLWASLCTAYHRLRLRAHGYAWHPRAEPACALCLLAAEAELWQAAQPPPRRITHAHRQQWAALPTLGV